MSPKYKCKDCGLVFDTEDARCIQIKTVSGGTTDYDTCPNCHSENLNEDYKEPEPEEEYIITEEDRIEMTGEHWCDVLWVS